MNYVSIGDLLQTFQIRRQNSFLKAEVGRLTNELASGKTSDISKAVAGDFTALAGIERSLATYKAFKITTGEASLAVESMQGVLRTIQITSSDLGPALLTASNSAQPSVQQAVAVDVRQKLDGVISQLNTQLADRSLFSGASLDQPALASGAAIMTDVMTAIAGLTTADSIALAIDGWFAPGGDFDTVAYLGSPNPQSAFQLSPDEQAQVAVTASDTAIREVLKGFVLGAVLAEGALVASPGEAAAILGKSGVQLITSQSELAVLQARVGSVEARIEAAEIANSAARTALEIARGEMIGIDPYDAATRLEETQSQLETLYTLTARLSRLSLADFLR